MEEIETHLTAVLGEQIRCTQAMLAALNREGDALLDGDPERLNAAGAEKAQLAETLESLESERRGLAAVLGANAHGAEPQWQSLIELIAQCKERNQRNGALLKERTEQVRAALKVLRGSDPEFYAASGLTPSSRSARSLGSA